MTIITTEKWRLSTDGYIENAEKYAVIATRDINATKNTNAKREPLVKK